MTASSLQFHWSLFPGGRLLAKRAGSLLDVYHMTTMKLSRNEPEEPHLQRSLDVSTNMTPIQSGCHVITCGRGRDERFLAGAQAEVCAVVGSLSVARNGQNMQLTFPGSGGLSSDPVTFSSCLTNRSGMTLTTVSDMMLEMS